jgi:hypothetical protein
MAITAKINVTIGIGRATITQASRSTVIAQNFIPKPNVSIAQLTDVTTTTVLNGQALIYNSAIGKYEANTISVPVVNGGDF